MLRRPLRETNYEVNKLTTLDYRGESTQPSTGFYTYRGGRESGGADLPLVVEGGEDFHRARQEGRLEQ
jgi:hypothetical protein